MAALFLNDDQCLFCHIEFNRSASVVTKVTPDSVASKDCVLPVGRTVCADLEMSNHTSNRVEESLVKAFYAVQVSVTGGIGEYQR